MYTTSISIMLIKIIICLLITVEVVKGKPQTHYANGFNTSNHYNRNNNYNLNNNPYQNDNNYYGRDLYNSGPTTTTKPLYPTLYPRNQPSAISSRYDPSAPYVPYNLPPQQNNFTATYPNPNNNYNNNFNGTQYNRNRFNNSYPAQPVLYGPTPQPTTTPYFYPQQPITGPFNRTSQVYPTPNSFSNGNYNSGTNNNFNNNFNKNWQNNYNNTGTNYPVRGYTPPQQRQNNNNNNDFTRQPLQPDYDIDGTPLAPFTNNQFNNNKDFNYNNIHQRQPSSRTGLNNQPIYAPQAPLAPF